MAPQDVHQSNPGRSQGLYQSDTDVQASKRTSIGLSAHRPTAPNTVQRPPDAGGGLSSWWPVFALTMLVLAVLIMLAARLIDPAATWADVTASINRTSDRIVDAPNIATSLLFNDKFGDGSGLISSYSLPEIVSALVLPEDRIYRVQVWPGQLAWNRFSVEQADTLAVETTAIVSDETPVAAVALFGRFGNDADFYLFQVDGEGRVAVLQYQNGVPEAKQPLMTVAPLNPAGQANRLKLEDHGNVLRFVGNDVVLAEVATTPVPAKQLGVGVLSLGEQPAVVTFSEVSVYQP